MKTYTMDDRLPFRSLHEDGIVLWKGDAVHPEPIHTHEFVEITYIYSGKGIHKINGTSYPVHRGDFLFINYNDTHCFEPIENLVYCNILLLPSFINNELINSENALDMLMLSTFSTINADLKSIHPFIHFQKKEAEEIESLINQMLVENENRDREFRTVLKSLMMVLLVKIFRKMQTDDSAIAINNTGKLTPEIIDYINKNCYEKISLSHLAQKCFYNPAYFSRIFKEYTGMTLTSFVQKQRIAKAQQLLVETERSVSDISSSVGYNDKTQFYKIFRKYSGGLLPNEFRSRYRDSGIPLPADDVALLADDVALPADDAALPGEDDPADTD